MGTEQLAAGNLVTLLIAILAVLEIIPWRIAGYLVIGTVLLTLLSHLRSRNHNVDRVELETTKIQPTNRIHLLPREQGFSNRHSLQNIIKDDQSNLVATQEKQSGPSEIIETPQDDASAPISEGDYLSFEVKLAKGEELFGEVLASGQVNAYILNEENLAALDSDQEFWYEAGSEGVKSTALRFTATEDGNWFLIVENVDAREVTAKAKITVTKPSHLLPSLKAEGLELPDARLEGKL